MKRLTNILSYLWLLLLMTVTACSDMEDETGPMQMEEEVELTIHTEVSGMKGSTRAQMEITEAINSIVAIAFDESNALIKKVDAVLTKEDNSTSGTLKIKVPKRTRTIHFLGNYKTTDIEGITTLETLNNFTTSDVTTMHYWGMTTFDGSNANLPVTLYRNMAKLTLNLGENLTGYIAGFVNYNTNGIVVPNSYEVGETPTIPTDVETNTHQADNSLGSVYYLFEHANTEDNPLYVILEVADKYYKVAFAAGDDYFPIIRNNGYTITITDIDEMYGEDYETAIKESTQPINDLVITETNLTVTPSATEVKNESGQTFTVTVTIPDGITELNVPTHDAFTITPPDGLTAQDEKYTVTPDSKYAFKIAVNADLEAGDKTISFSGRGKYKRASGSATVTLVDEEEKTTVNIEVEPSATTLNYADSSVEDLLVNVTIPSEVTGLSFTSDDFTIKVVGNELTATDGVYTITHAEDATETTVPVRIRLNDGESKETASFTFSGTSNDANVIVQGETESITLSSSGDANVRWQGSVPLNENELATIVPLMYEWFLDGNDFISAGSKLNLEFNVTDGNTSWLEVFEIQGETEDDWTNHEFEELNDENRYVATGNGNNVSLSLTLTNEIFEAIKENFRTDFLGETKIAMAIRGAGITLTKVSVVPAEELQTVAITATPYTNTLNYSTNSVSDLIVNVTIPAGVTTLDFSSDYFEVVAANGRTKTVTVDGVDVSTPYITGSGPYTVDHQGESSITLPFRLRLKAGQKTSTSSAGFTFSGTGESVTVTPATVNNITLAESGDEYVRWQGDVLLNWGTDGGAAQIPLLYSWFYDESSQLIVPVGSTLRVEYETTAQNDAIIQFAEVKDEWNDDAYYFSELRVETNNNGNTEIMGLNLAQNTGIYENNRTTFDLKLTQDVLTNMTENRVNLLGETDVVMAIQGGNVTLKSISVIPATDDNLDITLDFYADVNANSTIANRDGNVYEDLLLGTSRFYLKATISQEDATKYAGQLVTLVNAFSNNGNQYENSYGAIHWDNSSVDANSSISSNSDATQLNFTVDANTTEYVIEWVFVTGSHYTGYGDIGFAYAIPNSQGYNVTGDTSATIGFTNEPVGTVLLDSPHTFTTESNGNWTSLSFDGPFPIGTKIILTFGTGGGIKLCDGSNNNLYVPTFASNNLYGTGGNSDLWMTAPTGNLVLDITEDIILYGKGTGTNNGNLSANYPLNDLIVESGSTVLDKVVVVYPEGYVQEEEEETVIFDYDFEDDNPIGGWGGVTSSVVYDEEKQSKVLKVERGSDGGVGQLGIGGGNYSGSYTVSMKLKTSTSVGTLRFVIQYSDGYAWRANQGFDISKLVLDSWENIITWDVTISESADQFVIRLENVEAGTVFYIDDLKLVKND